MGSELHYAARAIRRSPGYAGAVVVTLALTIGANAIVFSLVRGVLLRPLPYAESDRLVSVYEQHPRAGVRLASYPTFADWRRDAGVFTGLAFVRGRAEPLRGPSGVEKVLAGYVSEDFFGVLGAAPRVGRTFTDEELRGTGGSVAVLSHELWRRRFGGDPGIVGRTLSLGDGATTIIGVMPPGLAYPDWANLWLPIATLPAGERALLEQRGLHVDSRVVGRLAPGVSLAQAGTAMDALAGRLARSHPAEQAGWTQARLTPVVTETIGDARTRLLVLQAAVLAVLLIGCLNLVNLSLSRGLARLRELGLRVALGASRGRLVRQLVLESVALVGLGAALGLLLAVWGLDLFRSAAAPGILPRLAEVALDLPVVGFVLGLSALATVFVGALPAWRVTGSGLAQALTEGGRQVGGGARTGRLRSGLIAAQLAVAMVLLTGAGLLIRSLLLLGDVTLGFEPGRMLSLAVEPPATRYQEAARALALYERVREAAGALPDVESAALTNHMPLTGASMATRVEPEGWRGEGEEASALFRAISAEYPATMGIPLALGRPLAAADMRPESRAVLVNEAFVRRYWPGADPLGRRVTAFKSVQSARDFGEPLEGEVVGVLRDVRHFGPEVEAVPEVYLPYPRNPPRWMSLVVRTRGKPDATMAPLQRAVLAVEPDIPVAGPGHWSGVVSTDELLARGRAPRTLQTLVLGGFAAAALILAVIGLAGVVAYTVAQRTREFAVRLALGAEPGGIVRLVLGRVLLLSALGVGIGMVGALVLTRFLAGLLFGVGPMDPATFGTVSVVLMVVTLVASWLPARRATRVDPMLSLRAE